VTLIRFLLGSFGARARIRIQIQLAKVVHGGEQTIGETRAASVYIRTIHTTTTTTICLIRIDPNAERVKGESTRRRGPPNLAYHLHLCHLFTRARLPMQHFIVARIREQILTVVGPVEVRDEGRVTRATSHTRILESIARLIQINEVIARANGQVFAIGRIANDFDLLCAFFDLLGNYLFVIRMKI
jgi:hypothetical protein